MSISLYTYEFSSCTGPNFKFSTSQSKLYSKNTDIMRQNGTVRQMNDPLLVKFIWFGDHIHLLTQIRNIRKTILPTQMP